MPNTVRAPAEGLPSITRRSFLAKSAATIPAAGLAAIIPASAVAFETPADIKLLIAEHERALAASDVAWGVVSDIDDAMGPRIFPKAQWGKVLLGRDDDGNDQFKPLFAYSEDAINEQCDRDIEHGRDFFGKRPGWLDGREQRRQRLLAEFRAQVAERDAAEVACGLSAARDAARAKSDLVEERLQAILDFPYASLAEFRVALAHIVDCCERGVEGVIEDETLADFAKRIVGVAS